MSKPMGRYMPASLTMLLAAWALMGQELACAAAATPQPNCDIQPFSSFVSPEMKAQMESMQSFDAPEGSFDISAPSPAIKAVRQRFDDMVFQPRVEQLMSLYPVRVEELDIEGVKALRVTPTDGDKAISSERVLINLHGGGFSVGGLVNGQLESIPVASFAKIPTITLDYRMGPEHKFPAASVDVAKVYTYLLKNYRAENIGIFGCSAGGWLAAQAVSWFQHKNLPRPGAVGILCMGAGGFGKGDSWQMWPLEGAQRIPDYLDSIDMKDPLVSPLYGPEVLAKFPPTLIMTSTRAVELSSAVHTDIELTKAGVLSELHVWDGLGHAQYIYAPATPEARDAAKMIAAFFDRHLGR